MIPPLWRRPLIAMAIAVALILLAWTALAAPAAAQHKPGRTTDDLVAGNNFHGLLGSLEIRTDSHRFAEQWAGVLRRTAAGPTPAAWHRLLAVLERPRTRAQLAALNRRINAAIRYRSDAEAHHAADLWSTPAEALAHGGDCEEYAVAKFAALRALGVPDQQLRVAIVRDGRALHAVLAVRLAGETWILDNRVDAVVAARYRFRYVPLWSANSTAQWTHVVTPQIRARSVEGAS